MAGWRAPAVGLAALGLGVSLAGWWIAIELEPPARSVALVGVVVVAAAGCLGLFLALALAPVPPRTPPTVSAAPGRDATGLGALSAGIVHEIGQPLSSARVSLEGLHYLRQLGREPSPEQVARTLDRVGMSLIAMNQILDHLRLLAGGGDRSLLPVGLGELVAALVADRERWLRFGEVRLEWRPPEAPVQAMADPTGLRLVLANLVRNAAEAVAGLPPERRWVRIELRPGPVIAVVDQGPGLAPEVRAHLFEPFISTRGEARGVGLSLARAAAEAMGGSLDCRTSPGHGTTFLLSLAAHGGGAA